jgi:hypothetical protein
LVGTVRSDGGYGDIRLAALTGYGFLLPYLSTRPIAELSMKYLCLVYSNEQVLHDSPESPQDAECMAYAESIQGSGRMLAAEALESVQTATTVRMRGGKLSITDGPFAETKEQLAGFYLIDAKDLNEAIQVAGHIPAARVGSVEVRPVRQLNP